MTQETRLLVRVVARLRAVGLDWQQIAEVVERPWGTVTALPALYRELWQESFRQAPKPTKARNVTRLYRQRDAKLRAIATMRIIGYTWAATAERLGMEEGAVFRVTKRHPAHFAKVVEEVKHKLRNLNTTGHTDLTAFIGAANPSKGFVNALLDRVADVVRDAVAGRDRETIYVPAAVSTARIEGGEQ